MDRRENHLTVSESNGVVQATEWSNLQQTTPGGDLRRSLSLGSNVSVCWWGKLTLLPHPYRLLQIKSFNGTLALSSHAIRADDRKVLACRLWQAVKEEFIPMVRKEESCKATIH